MVKRKQDHRTWGLSPPTQENFALPTSWTLQDISSRPGIRLSQKSSYETWIKGRSSKTWVRKERKRERASSLVTAARSHSGHRLGSVAECGAVGGRVWCTVAECCTLALVAVWCSAVWQWVKSVAVVAARAKRHFPPCGHLQTRLHTGSPALIYWRMLRNTQRY